MVIMKLIAGVYKGFYKKRFFRSCLNVTPKSSGQTLRVSEARHTRVLSAIAMRRGTVLTRPFVMTVLHTIFVDTSELVILLLYFIVPHIASNT